MVARDRQNKGTLSTKTTSITSMTTKHKQRVAVICRRFTKNVLYQCDLKWELPFSPYTQRIF
jgi:hypothetical protein